MSFISKLAIFIAILLTILGCGGGTMGTGGTGSTEYRGLIISDDGRPLQNATITLEQSDDTTVSDADGKWKIETNYEAPDVTLLVETTTTTASTKVSNLKEGPKTVDLTLKLAANKSEVEITEQKTVQKTPTPTPTINVEMTATPIGSQTPIPTATPVVVATVTPTPTATPQPVTHIIGTLFSDDPALFQGRVRIVGGPGRGVDPNGSFRFRAVASDENKYFAFTYNSRRALFTIPEITRQTAKATISIKVQRNGNKLTAEVLSVNVVPFS